MRTATLNFVPHLLSGLVSLSRGAPLPDAYQNVSFITLEEHWMAPTFVDLFINSPTTPLINGQALVPNLTDIGPRRLADMDANNISIQIISSATISPEANYLIEQNKLANDQLAARISNATYKTRFRGFCQLPMVFPDAVSAFLSMRVVLNQY
jgi:predicted TIM-barrel fold metal-dependent hydrolase